MASILGFSKGTICADILPYKRNVNAWYYLAFLIRKIGKKRLKDHDLLKMKENCRFIFFYSAFFFSKKTLTLNPNSSTIEDEWKKNEAHGFICWIVSKLDPLSYHLCRVLKRFQDNHEFNAVVRNQINYQPKVFFSSRQK